jgi:D-methionine transport system substrate-binding protein
MKKLLSLITVLTLALTAFLSTNVSFAANTTLTVEATKAPHSEILEKVKPILAKQGVDLKIVVVTEYAKINVDTNDGIVDANFFQHVPYLDDFNKKKGTNLVPVAKVHVEPIGVYSKKYKKLSKLPNGATIAIPNDTTNKGRALILLQKQKLITLKNPKNIFSTERDIIKNPKNLKFKTLDAAIVPRVLPDVDAAVINTNYALIAKLNPIKDSLAIESSDSPYANVLVVKKGNEKNAAIQKLVKALNSAEIKKFINDKYKGAVVPAF